MLSHETMRQNAKQIAIGDKPAPLIFEAIPPHYRGSIS
jgi:hypothetical protein